VRPRLRENGRSRLPAILAVTIATIGLVAAALALLSGVTTS
jgi:hypothetical protein